MMTKYWTLLLLLCVMGKAWSLPPSTDLALPETQYLDNQSGSKLPFDASEQDEEVQTSDEDWWPVPGESEAYQLNQSYASEQETLMDENKQAAIKAYNRGVDATIGGQEISAMSAYQKAIRLDPNLIEAYNNLGALLEKQKQYELALQVYQKGLKVNPKEAVLHRNLGVLYEKLGKVEASMSEYELYLQYSPQADAPIKAIVENYKATRQAGLSSSDYVWAARQSSSDKDLLWSRTSQPIKYYVWPGHPKQAMFVPVIAQSMREWSEVTRGRLQFKEVGLPEQAQIVVLLKDGPFLDSAHDIAHTEYKFQQEVLGFPKKLHMRVSLNTGSPQDGKLPVESQKEQFHRMVLHEVGHAIGIWGHSPDSRDIMYAHPIAGTLSKRDIRTIQRLYGLKMEKAEQ